jgi:signal transduction histidine kinase
LEHAHNILFFDKATPAAMPDVKALEFVFQLADIGILVVNKSNDVLYANNFAHKIAAHFHLKNKLVSVFTYAFADGGEGNIALTDSNSHSEINIRSSLVSWNGEKAALFLIKEHMHKHSVGVNSDFYLATLLMENVQLPMMLFQNDLLVAANLSATNLLEINSDEYHKTHFAHFFDKQSKAKNKKTDTYLEAVQNQVIIRSEKEPRNIISGYLSLDGKQYQLVQVLPKKIVESTEGNERNFSAHDVITMASHDLREPVRTISNFSQLTVEKLKNGKYKQAFEYAQMTNTAALHMDKLLGDLKVLISVDEVQLEKKKINTEIILKAAIAEVTKFHEAGTFDIQLHQLPEIVGNEKLLILLFKNLLDNAIKFRKKDKAQIEVVAEKENDHVIFCVRDNGIGIARKHHQKVFEPFERLNRIDEFPGSGLGLTIAKKIIEKHNGSIYIESMANAGTSVYVTIPA